MENGEIKTTPATNGEIGSAAPLPTSGSSVSGGFFSPAAPVSTPRPSIPQPQPPRQYTSRWAIPIIVTTLVIFALIGAGAWLANALTSGVKPVGNALSSTPEGAVSDYDVTSVPLGNLPFSNSLQSQAGSQLLINGQVQVNKSLVLSPTGTPSKPQAGELYFSQTTNQPYYYDGQNFVSIKPVTDVVNSVGGLTGNVSLGASLRVTNGVLDAVQGSISSLTGTANQVLVSASTGDVVLALPQDIATSSSPTFAGLTATGTVSAGNTTTTSLGLGTANASTGSATFYNAASAGSLTLQSGNMATDVAFTLPTSDGTSGQCLATDGAGALSFIACASGSAAGVTSLNGLTGSLTIANASSAGTTITLNNASTTQKGIAQFNATNFTVTTGVVNTVQDIATAATPTFAGLNLGSPLTVANGGTGGTTAGSARSNLGAAASGANNDITSTSNLNVITPSGDLTIGATSQKLTLQGTGTSTITATTGGNTTTVGFTAPLANTVLNFPALSAGTYNICTSSGNCSTSGGGVTTTGGTTNKLAKFSGAQTIIDSIISDDGTTATIAGNGVVQGASGLTLGVGSTTTGKLAFKNASNANTVTLQAGTSSSNLTFTLPTADGTSGQCLSTNGAGALSFAGCVNSAVSSVDGLTGDLTIANTSGSGTTITIDNASTTQKGIAQFNATNFSVVSGVVNTIQSIATTASPTFASLTLTNPLTVANGGTGSSTAAGARTNLGAAAAGANNDITSTNALNTITPTSTLTIGATGQSFVLQGNAASAVSTTSGGNTTTLGFSSPIGNTTLNLPALSAGTYNICTSSGNCATAGGGVTTTGGTTNVLAKFGSAQTLVDSILSDNGSTVTIAGNGVIQGANGLMLGVGTTTTGKLVFANATNNNTITLQSGVAGASVAFTLPTADGTSGQCLSTDGSGNLSFANCTGSGVTSLNGLSGALTIANASGIGSTITINDASTSQKGLAQFNATNFTVASGVVNTIQNISTTSSPTFASLTLTNPLTVANGGTGSNTAAGARANLGAAASGANSDITSISGLTTALSITQGGTGATTANTARNNLGAAASGANADISSTSALNTITPSSSLTVGAIGQSFTLQGNGSSTVTATVGGNTTTLAFASPVANTTLNVPALSAGSYTLCTTSGNCAGVGGGVTTSGGTTNQLAKFGSAQTIVDSIINDNGSTVTVAGNGVIQGAGGLTLGQSSTADGKLIFANATNTNTVTLQSGATSGSFTLTLPTGDGSGGQCVSTNGSGTLSFKDCISTAVTSLNGLTGNLTLANASTAGSTITINDASTTQKGIAQFNSTNFSVASGVVNTVQNINTTASPTFANLTLTNPLTVANGGTGSGTAGGARTNLGAAASGANSDITSLSGLTTALSITQGGTGATTAPGARSNLGAAASGTNNDITATTALNTITPNASLTVGATAQSFLLQGNQSSSIVADNGTNHTTVAFANPTANVTLTVPALSAGSYTFCTTSGNCAGAGGGVTTTGGTTNQLAKFTGSQTIADSIITDDGSTVTVSGAAVIQGAGGITVGQTNTTTGQVAFANSSNANILTLQSGVTASNLTFTLPTADGTSGQCLSTDGSGVLSFHTCLSGSGPNGGVTSLNTLVGALTIANASTGGSTITINNASTTQKGIVQFNSTNFSVASGVANTIQDIATTSSPTFASLTLSSPLTVANGGTGATTASGARGNLGAAASGANSDITSISGLTTALSVNQGGTGATTAAGARSNLGAAASGTNNDITATTALNTITPTSALTVGATGQSFTLQGNGTSTITATDSGNTTTLAFTTPVANTILNLPALSAGTYSICTTSGNCAGSGGGVTTSGGTTNQLAKFSGSQTIVDSIISDDGTTATIAGNGVVQGAGGLTLGVASSTAGKLVFANATNANTVTLQSGVVSASLTFTLPTADGTSNQCLKTNGSGALSFGACLTTAVTSLNSLTGTLTIANASTAGSTITINDASTTQKGIAQFNATNFSVTSGVVNTIQDIATSSSPTFTGLTLGSPLTVANGGTGATTASAARTNLGAAASGANSDITSISGLTTALSVSQGGTGATTAAGARSNLSAAISGTNNDITATTALNTITPTSTLTVGATSQSFVLQGNNSSTIVADNGTSTTTLAFTNPVANTTLNFPALSAGTYSICTTSGNCAGSGGGVTTTGGTTNFLAKFSGAQTIVDSIISDNGSTVTVAGDGIIQGAGGLTLGVGSSATGKVVFANSTNNNTLTLQSGVTGSNLAFTLPTADGSANQCLKTDGSGVLSFGTCLSTAVTSLNSLTGAVTIANATTGGSTITINNASTSQKGIAQFNATNFSVASGVVNTIQDIATTSSPTFASLTLTNPLTIANGGTGATTASAARVNLSAASSGANSDITSISGLTTALSVSQGGTGATTASGARTNLGAAASGTNGDITATTALNAITPNSSLTVGATSQTFLLQGNQSSTIVADNGTNHTTIAFANPTANVTLSIPALSAGSYNFCTTSGNCSGVGGGVTTPGGTANQLAKFTGSQTLGDSIITDNGTTVTVSGAAVIQGSGGVTVGQASTADGKVAFANATNSNILTLQTGATAADVTFTLPTADGSSGQCLSTDGSGVLSFHDCLSGTGSGGGVTSLNSLSGALTIANSTGSGSVITINDASTSQKGIAQFNATNFTASSGTINTIQSIATTSSPTFAGLTLSSPLTVANGGTGATTASAARTNLGAAASGANSDITSISGLTTALSVSQGGTGATTAAGARSNLSAAISGTNNDITATTALNTITPTGALTIGATGQSFTLQGNQSSTIVATNGTKTTTLAFTNPVANTTLNFPAVGADGTYTICTTSGNCAGIGGGVTTSGGTTNQLAKFSSSQAIVDSIISDDGSTVTVAGNGVIQGAGGLTIGVASTADGKLVMQNATNAHTLTLISGATTSDISFTLPTADGSSGQCLSTDGSGVLSFKTCLSGSGPNGGVSSLDGLVGSLTIANTSGASSTITIDNASTSQKGIAQFNSTNFSASAGTINTIQNIATTSSPTFASLTLTNPLTVANGGTGASTASGARSNLGAAASGANSDITSISGLTTALSVSQGGTGATTAAGARSNLSAAISGTNNDITATTALNTITPNSSLTVGATSQSFLLQGNTSSTIVSSNGTNTTTVAFANPTANVTLTVPALSAGSYNFCTTSGNCAGVAGGVTTTGGTTNQLAKFTGSQTIGNSIIADNGSVVTISGAAAIQGAGGVTVGQASTTDGKVAFVNATNANILTLQSGATASNLTFTLPTADGTSGQCLSTNGSGVFSFKDCLGTAVTSLNGLTGGLTIANASGSGATITINDASTSQKGIAQFNATNFTASTGVINTIQDIATTSSPTFAGLTLTTALTVANGGTGATTASGARSNLGAAASGTNADITSTTALNTITPSSSLTVGATGQSFLLQGNQSSSIVADNGTNHTTVDFANPTANVTLTVPALSAGSYNFCTTSGNCAGVGGGVTTSGGTINQLAKFTGSQTLGNSIIADNGSTVTVSGAAVIQGAGGVTVGQASTTDGKVAFANATNAHTLTLQSGATAADITFTLPTADGSTNQCLKTDGSGVLSFGTCLATAVTSLNGLTGALTIANASTGGSTITINDASTTQKGIAQFNSTNFSASAGVINTIQNIATTSSPTFASLTLSTPLSVGNGGTGATTASGARTNLGAAASGANSDITSISGLTTALSVSQGGTGATTAAGARSNLSAAISGTNNDITATTALNTITPTGALTIGATGQSFTLQGNTSSTIVASNGTNTTTLGFTNPVANTTLNFPALSAGTYSICTTSGNCAGSGGGVTTTGGTTNQLAKFTGSQTLGNSIITDDGSTVTIAGNGVIQGAGGLTIGVASTADGKLVMQNATNAHTLTLVSGATASDLSFTLPTADGSSGQCLSTNGSGILSFQTCLTGSGSNGGVSSLDGLVGALTLANSSGSSTTVTIDNASTTQKGIAQFNSTNFSASAGTINTIQNISTTSSPTFASLTLTNPLTVANGGTGASTAAGARTNLGAAASGANSDITSISGLTTALSVSQGGTGATTLTANGILYGNGTGAIQATSAAANSILATNGSNVPSLTQTLPTVVQGNITSTGALASGSIASGFGTISTGNNITTTATLQGATVNATGTLQVGGADINTAGTLSNVAYLNQTQSFTGANTFSRNGSGAGDATLAVTGTPVNNATSSLVRIGNAIAGGNNAVNGGTYIGLNAPNTGAGSAADFLNFQKNGTSALKVANTGDITTTGNLALNGGSLTSTTTLTITGNGTGSLVLGSGIIELQDDTLITGHTHVSGDAVEIGDTAQQGSLQLDDGSAHIGTVQTTTLTAARTYTLPDASGTFCLSTGNCTSSITLQTAYNNSTDPELTLDATRGALSIRDASTPLGANLLEVQNNARTTTYFAVSASGTSTTGTSTATGNINSSGGGLQTAGTTRIDNGGVISNASYQGSTIGVQYGGTGAATFTTNGILYGNGTGAIQATSAAANSVLATNGSNVPSLTQTLPTAVQGNITSTGALASGSITTGFGTISTGNNITTTAAVQGATVNATSALQLNGTSINTAGTLTNVAYLNNTTQTFTGVNLFSRNSTGAGDATLAVTGTPVNNATSSLVRIGNSIASGNTATNGGTYLGINAPSSGGGSAADFVNFQQNGTSRFAVTGAGNVGLGTATPGSDNPGNAGTVLSIQPSSGAGTVLLGATNQGGGQIFFGNVNGYNGGIVYNGSTANSANDVTIYTGGVFSSNAHLDVGSNGTVAVGNIYNITPTGTLDVRAASSSLSLINASGTTTGTAAVINNTGTGSLLDVQQNGSSKLSISNSGTVTISALNSTGVVQTNGSGVLSTGNLNLQTGPVTGTLQVANGGIGAATLTANGILYGNGTSAVQATSAAANSILATNGSNIPSLTQTLPTAVQGNITTTTTVQGATINATTGFQLNGTPGSSTTCSGGQFLQNQVVSGGITTGGSCATAVTTIGTIDSQTKSANGAVISGNNIVLQTADATNPGLVSTGTQTFAGAKTFTGDALFKDGTNSATAFQIQNSSGTNIVSVDTSANGLVVGHDGASQTAMTIRGGAATGTNAAGADLTIDASNGTGTGGSGAIILRTAAASVSTITHDSSASNTSGFTAVSSLTWSQTVNNNANRLLIVGVNIADKTKTISTVKFNGADLTKLAGKDCNTTCHTEFWYMTNPTITTANVVVTLTSGTTEIDGGSSSYYNVDPTSPIALSTTASGAANPSSVTLSGTTTSQLVVDVFGDDNRIFGVNGSATLRYNTDGTGGSPVASSSLSGGSGSTTMQWSDASSNWATVVAALSPPAGTSSDTLQDRLHISASGNVGIGKASPSFPLDVTGNINSSTGYLINGANLNTAGTLSNVAYLTATTQTFTGINLFSRNGSGSSDATFALTGTPVNNATSSLMRIGNSISGGNTSTNGGTYLGLNAPSSGAGSAADFINFQQNGSSNFRVTGAGGGSFGAYVLAPVFDTASAAILNFGTTNATSINLGQATSLAAGKNLSFTSGAGNFDQSASTGTFATGTGTVSLNGNTTVASNKSLTAQGTALFKDATNATSAFQIQNSSGSNLFTADTSNGNIVLGNDGTPAALTVRGGAATGTDVAGSNITFAASNGTGGGGSGDIIFQTASIASGGTITQDAVSAAQHNAGTTSLSWSFTVGSNSNRLLVVGVSTYQNSPSSVKLDGTTNFTQLSQVSNGGNQAHSEIWYLKNPSSGAHTIAVNFATSTAVVAGSVAYYNVNQSSTFGTPATNTGNSKTATNTVLGTNSTQLIFDNLAFAANVGSWSSSQTQLWNDGTSNGGAASAKTGTSSNTSLTWTNSSTGEQWADAAVAINPIGAGSGSDTLTDRLHIAANGNIGIGTASPADTLSIATGNILLGDGSGSRINLTGSPTTSTNYSIYGSSTETILNTSASNGDIAFKIQNAEVARFTSNGQLGLGTTTPGATLDLSSSGTIQGAGLSSDCSAQNSKLLWSSSTKQFSCGTDRASVSIRKASDQSVTNSTTLVNDNDFSFSIGANETWAYQIFYDVAGNTTADFKAAVSAPTGSTCRFDSNNIYTVTNSFSTTCGASAATTQGDTADEEHIDFGTVISGGTSGTVNFKWAENTSSGTTTVRAGGYMIAFKLSGADVAEQYYSKDRTIQPGDIVSVDGSLQAGVRKSNGAYDSTALGIVSTEPGFVLGDPNSKAPLDINLKPVLLALNGRVPVKVTAMNGAIHAGDYLAPSPIPGVAMKATAPGQMIGKALEDYSSSDPTKVGTALVFVNLGWADPSPQSLTNNANNLATFTASNVLFKDASDSSSALQIQNTKGVALLTADTKNMIVTVANLTVTGTLTVNGHIITGGDTPTISPDAAACTNATTSINGNDTSGLITLTAGNANCAKGGPILTVTFNKPYTAAPRVVMTPASASSAQLQTYIDNAAVTTSKFDLSTTPASSLTPGASYQWYYQVLQ